MKNSFAIERILDSRTNSEGQVEYLIKWKDYPESENSWQPVHHLYSTKKSPPATSSENAPQMNADNRIDSDNEQNVELSDTDEPLTRDADAVMKVKSKGNVAAKPVQRKLKPATSNEHVNEPVSKKMRGKRRENVSKEIDEQPKPANKRGRPKKKAQFEHDSTLAEQSHQQQAVANETPSSTTVESTIDRVETMRKRNNRHEYLVTWTTGDTAEWIGRDLMITKYSQDLIAYYERIIQFKPATPSTS